MLDALIRCVLLVCRWGLNRWGAQKEKTVQLKKAKERCDWVTMIMRCNGRDSAGSSFMIQEAGTRLTLTPRKLWNLLCIPASASNRST